MLLFAAIGILGVVAAAGLWLAGQVLLAERPLSGLRWQGALHGAGGFVGLVVLAAALRAAPPAHHAVSLGVGSFGKVAGALMAMGLLAGGVILLAHLRRRPVSIVLVATHGLLGITGYTLLVTYLTMLH